MRYAIIILTAVALVSCSRDSTFDADAATNWSRTADIQSRKKASTYCYQRPDGSWVAISTAALKETSGGFVSTGAVVFATGYAVYPGNHQASTIEDAIRVASGLPQGLHLK
jgi:hypothetical protein